MTMTDVGHPYGYEEDLYENDILKDDISLLLQNKTLDEVLKKDNEATHEADRKNSWYHGKIDRGAAESLLNEGISTNQVGSRNGIFLVRDSTSMPNSFVLSVTNNSQVYQFQLKEVMDGHYQLDQGPVVHGLDKLIQYYHDDRSSLITKLTKLCKGSPPPPKTRVSGPTNILHRAVRKGDTSIVRDILNNSQCPDVNAKNEWENTALHDACSQGFVEIVKLLIDYKADVDMKGSNNMTPLHTACANDRSDIIPILMEKGNADVLAASPKTSWIPIHDAAMRGNIECIKALLQYHSPMWPRAEDDQTPLDLARKYNRIKCDKLLSSPDKRPLNTRTEDWLHPMLDRENAYEWLKTFHRKDGMFLVRKSRRNENFHVITVCHQSNYYNYEVKFKEYFDEVVYFVDKGPYFQSLERLIEHYSRFMDGMQCRLLCSINTAQELVAMNVDNEYYNIEKDAGQVRHSTGHINAPWPVPPRPSPSHHQPLPPRDEIQNKEEEEEDIYTQAKDEEPMEHTPPPLPETKRPSKTLQKQTSAEETTFKNIIHRKDLKLGNVLGEGEFGEVKKGVYVIKDGVMSKKKIDVAVKTFHQNENASALNSIKREAILMQNLEHKCIVRLYGICEDPFMLVEEFVSQGALCDYLVKYKDKIDVKTTLYTWAHQVADGMKYLEGKRIVHRDLAARNILVESTRLVKISDFGLSRAYEETDYYKASKGGRWPIKWYAPECVNFGKFDHKTDIWSFGITLWEMFSFGEQPYDDMKGIEVIQFVESGQRLSKPEACPETTYREMCKCWEKKPENRPTFGYLYNHFVDDPVYACAHEFAKNQKKK